MIITEALGLLKQVCAQYTGNLKEHQALQTALGVVEKECSSGTSEIMGGRGATSPTLGQEKMQFAKVDKVKEEVEETE